MKIQVLGTRGNVEKRAPYHSKHSGVLVDDKLLFDLGEKEFLGHDPEYIFITHLHPDHAFFLKEKIEEIKCPIYVPETSKRPVKLRVMPKSIRTAIAGSYQYRPFTALRWHQRHTW